VSPISSVPEGEDKQYPHFRFLACYLRRFIMVGH